RVPTSASSARSPGAATASWRRSRTRPPRRARPRPRTVPRGVARGRPTFGPPARSGPPPPVTARRGAAGGPEGGRGGTADVRAAGLVEALDAGQGQLLDVEGPHASRKSAL